LRAHDEVIVAKALASWLTWRRPVGIG
jgi:hypothetical protein